MKVLRNVRYPYCRRHKRSDCFRPKTAISPDEHRYAPTILTAAFVGSGRAICIYAMFDLAGKWGAFRSLPYENRFD